MSVSGPDEELAVPAVPEFDLTLPPGWARHAIDDDTLAAMLSTARERCMRAHSPQLFAELTISLEQAFADMRKAGVFAYFCPTDPGEGTLAVPASINASIRRAEGDGTLDDMARSLIRTQGATPLLGDPRTLRFETERTAQLGAATVVSHSLVYLTPVPGSRRQRALALVAGFGRPPETPADAPTMAAMRFMFDACVSSLRWRPRANR